MITGNAEMMKTASSSHLNAFLGNATKTTRRSTPNKRSNHIQSIKGTGRPPPRLLVSFYSMLRNAPIFVEDTQLHIDRQANEQGSLVSLRRDQQYAQAARYLNSTHIPHVFHIIPPYIRGYTTSVGGVVPAVPASRFKRTTPRTSGKPVEEKVPGPPDRSNLHPPKHAPSVWQIFFTDWLQSQRLGGKEGKKLNIVDEAKAAGRAYNKLSEQTRADLDARAKVLKENYERELAIWKRTLTPADVEQENAFRTAQRKSGKSRQKNINDPNAPKRPLSPYFLYLQAIRADPQMIKEVFGDVTAPIQQSMLAAAKWRSMDDAEKRPYLEKAKNAKMIYEAKRKIYENTESLNKGPSTSFSINSGINSPPNVAIAEPKEDTSRAATSNAAPKK